MAIRVKFNFKDIYPVDEVSVDLRTTRFHTVLEDDSLVELKVRIEIEAEELLPYVYNLAFGPMDKSGNINDMAQLHHKNYSKCFSTILFSGLSYLKRHPDNYLGIDGSDNRRAVLYFRLIQNNYDYLSQFFNIYGIKYYVRVTRFGKRQYDNPFDFDDITAYPERILKNKVPLNLYNYFIFRYNGR